MYKIKMYDIQTRLKIYKLAAELLAVEWEDHDCICDLFYDAHKILRLSYRSLEWFPEIYKYKPEHSPYGAYWFLPDEMTIRMAILLLAIDEIEQQLNKK